MSTETPESTKPEDVNKSTSTETPESTKPEDLESTSTTGEETGLDDTQETGEVVKDSTTEQTTPVTNIKKKDEMPCVSFFNQYLELTKACKPDKGIIALNNCLKAMLKNGSSAAFNAVFKGFRENIRTLSVDKRLQEIASLSKADRAVAEVITTIYHVLITDPSKPIDLEKARVVIKSDSFINWCAKKIK